MKIILQIGIVLGICFLGEGLEMLLPFPFPASVISMILLFVFSAADNANRIQCKTNLFDLCQSAFSASKQTASPTLEGTEKVPVFEKSGFIQLSISGCRELRQTDSNK